MAGPSDKYPIKAVELFDTPQDLTRWGVKLTVGTLTSDFPAATLVSVNASDEVVNYDETTGGIALTYEGSNDVGLNIVAGTSLYASRKSEVHVLPIGGKRLIMTAGSSGGTTVLQSTDIGKSFDVAIDSASGYAYVDLDNPYDATLNPTAPAKIVDLLFVPDGPRPYDTTLSTDQRLNARVVVEIDSSLVYTP